MTTKEFIKYASERPELCEKLSACTAPEEVYAIAEKEGLTDDLAAFTAVMEDVKKEAEALSEDDLEQISAAGTTTAWKATCIASISVQAAAAAGGI